MAYTPINWQTGDTITAEKLNKMDPGWGFGSKQLFSETVTTQDAGAGFAAGALVYVFQTEPPAEAVVTFDGTDYTVERNADNAYGEAGESGPDFTNYPFYILPENDGTDVYTETAGTHTVAVSTAGVEVSDGFNSAVNECVQIPSSAAILCVTNVTHYSDVVGKALPFFYDPNNETSLHIITNAGTTCTIFPESNTLSAHFGRDDGLFYITTS